MLRALLLIPSLLVAVVAGCQKAPAPPAEPDAPRDVARRLVAARELRDYATIAACTVPDKARIVVDLLAAADHFLAANERLCRILRAKGCAAVADALDQSVLADHLELFSRHVELISQTIEDRRAQVAFTVDGRLPLRRADFVLTDDGWRYDPGESCEPELARTFDELAARFSQVAADCEAGRIDLPSLRHEPRRLLALIAARLQPPGGPPASRPAQPDP